MDESAEIGSVFKAKPELDPFYLYGLADSNYGVEDGNDEALEAIADSPSDLIRMKLARLEERRRFFQKRAEEDILETGNDDHEAVGESEEEEEDEDEQVVQGSSAVKTAASKSRSDGMDVAARISHSLFQISGVFSQVFQAFLALMEEAHIAEVSKFSPAEKSRISKRAAEFEIRLKRRTFELKQKVKFYNEISTSCRFPENRSI